jgi:hypothetical protein
MEQGKHCPDMTYETHRNKSWFGQECSELADKRKQERSLWLQNSIHETVEYFTNIRSDPI